MLQCAKIGVTQIVPLVEPVYGARCISIFETTERLRARQQANVRSKVLAVALANETVFCRISSIVYKVYKSVFLLRMSLGDYF